jgi:hypothetical protein
MPGGIIGAITGILGIGNDTTENFPQDRSHHPTEITNGTVGSLGVNYTVDNHGYYRATTTWQTYDAQPVLAPVGFYYRINADGAVVMVDDRPKKVVKRNLPEWW